jgi:hypothetical protein
MMFTTPEELAAHLAMTIDDEAFIAKAVRIKFPDWNFGEARSHFEPKDERPRVVKPRVNRKAEYAGREYKAVRADQDWYAAERCDKAFKAMIETGTGSLLRALHQSHPQILGTLKANGRQVVQP